jgi:uncharacterized protein YukE
MSNLGYTASNLDAALTTLRARWETARASWNDPVQHAFEREFWAGIEREAQATIRAMEALSQVISQAERAVK